MSFCKQEGKDQIIFVTEEDQSTPSSVVFEEPPDEPVGPVGKDGEINWNCPCLGNMATGPCGVEFRESFSCYQNSTDEQKGSDCVDHFRKMTECFAEYPEVYYSRDELGDPEEESKKDEEQTSTEVAVSSEKEKVNS